MRYSTRIVIFLFFLNAAATLLMASGVAGGMGINPQPGGGDAISEANKTVSGFEASGGFGGTLYGLYVSVTGVAGGVFGVVFVGPAMLQNLGVPGYLVDFVFAPAYLLVGIDLIYMIAQRRM